MEAIDIFGKMVIEARDEAISSNIYMVEGRMKWPTNEYFTNKLEGFSSSQKEVIKEIVTKVADDTIHGLLTSLYNETDTVLLGIKKPEDTEFKNAHALSDGYNGDLLLDDGWIARFGKYPSIYNEL